MGQFPVSQQGIVTCLLTHDDGGPAVEGIIGVKGISQDDQITQIDLGITEIASCTITRRRIATAIFGWVPQTLWRKASITGHEKFINLGQFFAQLQEQLVVAAR